PEPRNSSASPSERPISLHPSRESSPDLNRSPARPQNAMHPRVEPGVLTWIEHRHGQAPARHQADFLFFLSSSTSVNSASPTSSFLPPEASAPPPGPPAAAPLSCACLYIASPSFIEACARALVLAVIAPASSPFKASLRSAIAFWMLRRSPSPTLEPCSASAFSVAWIKVSAWFLA